MGGGGGGVVGSAKGLEVEVDGGGRDDDIFRCTLVRNILIGAGKMELGRLVSYFGGRI